MNKSSKSNKSDIEFHMVVMSKETWQNRIIVIQIGTLRKSIEKVNKNYWTKCNNNSIIWDVCLSWNREINGIQPISDKIAMHGDHLNCERYKISSNRKNFEH